jgi:transcriptional regulator with XRE-family HTH domain
VKEKVAERIRMTRLSKGLSQQNMADDIGITVAAYSNIERGVTDISVTRMYQIAAVLKVNPFSFLSDSGVNILNDSAENTYVHSTGISQQVYMLIQQVQTLNSRIDQLDYELSLIKRS